MKGILDDEIALDISGLVSHEIDVDRIMKEIEQAEKIHPYLRRTPVWHTIALRSANGEMTEESSGIKGIYNSSDSTIFKNTDAMQPYIKSIIDEIGAPTLKIRVLKLRAGKSIGEHVDNFQTDNVIRLHIPVVTHPLVEFWLDSEQYFFPIGKLYYLNVSKRHKVVNKSHVDRVHIVFDVIATEELIKRIKKCAKRMEKW